MGKMMKCGGYWQTKDCPCCRSRVVETLNHILWCPDLQMAQAYEGGTDKLIGWQEDGVRTAIAEVWMAYLQAWGTRNCWHMGVAPSLEVVDHKQDLIRWEHIMLGRVVREWRDLQDQWLRR